MKEILDYVDRYGNNVKTYSCTLGECVAKIGGPATLEKMKGFISVDREHTEMASQVLRGSESGFLVMVEKDDSWFVLDGCTRLTLLSEAYADMLVFVKVYSSDIPVTNWWQLLGDANIWKKETYDMHEILDRGVAFALYHTHGVDIREVISAGYTLQDILSVYFYSKGVVYLSERSGAGIPYGYNIPSVAGVLRNTITWEHTVTDNFFSDIEEVKKLMKYSFEVEIPYKLYDWYQVQGGNIVGEKLKLTENPIFKATAERQRKSARYLDHRGIQIEARKKGKTVYPTQTWSTDEINQMRGSIIAQLGKIRRSEHRWKLKPFSATHILEYFTTKEGQTLLQKLLTTASVGRGQTLLEEIDWVGLMGRGFNVE